MDFKTPKYFFVKKYILVNLCACYILFLGFYPFFASKVGDYELSASRKGVFDHDEEEIFWVIFKLSFFQ